MLSTLSQQCCLKLHILHLFIQWYIVLPMVIFTLFGGAEPPPEGATGSDKGDKAQPATK